MEKVPRKGKMGLKKPSMTRWKMPQLSYRRNPPWRRRLEDRNQRRRPRAPKETRGPACCSSMTTTSSGNS